MIECCGRRCVVFDFDQNSNRTGSYVGIRRIQYYVVTDAAVETVFQTLPPTSVIDRVRGVNEATP